MHRSLAFSCALALALAAPSALCDPFTFKLSGYGTAGLVHSSESQADYAIDQFKPNGPGATRAWSADVDSKLGGQATMGVTDTVTAVLQVIAQQRYDDSYRPTVEWANVRWQVTPDASVRAGRIVLPVFMVSDFRKVGYANPWVRPPVEFYSMVPVTNNDGVDASWRLALGDVANTLQATYGNSKSNFPAQGGV